jgi:hydrogenase maturation protease
VLEPSRHRSGGPGHISRVELEDVALRRRTVMVPHGLLELMELAREVERLPGHLVSYAVEVGDTAFGRGLSAPVAAAVGVLVERVEEDIVRYRVAEAEGAVVTGMA